MQQGMGHFRPANNGNNNPLAGPMHQPVAPGQNQGPHNAPSPAELQAMREKFFNGHQQANNLQGAAEQKK